jgi:predicted regulator of Ras-like GTPase activity (Roadblock/LC7/MglB family)
MLLVRASANEGLIYYQDGEVVHAVSQDQSGESAFRQIVSWQSDDFAVFTDEPPPNRSIFRDFDTLLNTAMEPAFSIEDRGLQIEDLSDQPVSDQLAEAPPPEPAIDVEPIITEFAPMPVESPTQEEDVSAPTLVEAPVQEYEPVIAEFVQQTEEAPAPLFVEEQQSPGIMEPEGQGAKEPESQEAISSAPVPLQTVASSVAQMPGFTAEEKRHLEELLMASDHLEGGALLTIDGLILASTISHKALKSSLLVEAGSLFQICRRLASELGRGNHRQSFIQGDLGNIIVSDVGAGSYLLFVTNAKATLGMALLQARQRAQKVSQLMANYAS